MPLTYRHFGPDLDAAATISVDGDAPGMLQLSHWPGNKTPPQFKHDLSTGICLRFVSSPERLTYLARATTVTNTHYDTDGVLSAFTLCNPIEALRHADVLLSAALCGDMTLYTTPEGVKLELTLAALTKHPQSPVHSDKFSDERERRQAQYDFAFELIPKVLEKPDLHYDWWKDEHRLVHADLRALREEEATLEHFAALDLSVVDTPRPLHVMAVNTAAWADRVLTIENCESGAHRFELRLLTFSWFEQPTRGNYPRPSWEPLLAALQANAPAAPGKWVADDLGKPSPRLAFVDASGRLAESDADPALVRRLVVDFYSRHPFLPAGM